MSNGTEEAHDDAGEATGRRPMDAEIRCLSALVRILDEIDEPARARAVAWLHARYTHP